MKKPFAMGSKTFIFGAVSLLVVLVALFFVWWFYPKALVTIYVSPKKLDEKINLFVDPKVSSVNFSEKVLPGEVLKTTQLGEKTTSATGTKTVGERAKGEVTIYRSGSQIKLPAGTTLYGPNNLNFTLDESVTVATGSAGSAGTGKAAVTAADIGSQYNLESNTSFSVANYPKSELEAKNESAFAGGSSREISAVSKEDQEMLLEDLTNELSQKAKSSLKSNISEDKFFIEESVVSAPSSKEFSAKVGDEADTLKLSLGLDVTAISVDKNSLFDLVREILKDKVPQGFVLRENQINMEFKFKGKENEVNELEVLIGANLLPEIDTEEIAKAISGKYPPLAEGYLRGVSGFTRARIKISPKFPGRLGTLPRISKNITIEVAAER